MPAILGSGKFHNPVRLTAHLDKSPEICIIDWLLKRISYHLSEYPGYCNQNCSWEVSYFLKLDCCNGSERPDDQLLWKTYMMFYIHYGLLTSTQVLQGGYWCIVSEDHHGITLWKQLCYSAGKYSVQLQDWRKVPIFPVTSLLSFIPRCLLGQGAKSGFHCCPSSRDTFNATWTMIWLQLLLLPWLHTSKQCREDVWLMSAADKLQCSVIDTEENHCSYHLIDTLRDQTLVSMTEILNLGTVFPNSTFTCIALGLVPINVSSEFLGASTRGLLRLHNNYHQYCLWGHPSPNRVH